MSRNPAPGGRTASFANLMSLARGGKPSGRAEDDKPSKDDEDEEARKARRAEEDERRKEEDARRAEEDDRRKEEDARRAEEDDGREEDDEDKKDGKKGKKADKEDGDDETCAEEADPDAKVAAAARAGRLAERARWAKALGAAEITADNVGAACVMLATTPMTSSAVLQAVTALPSPSAGSARRPSLDERMQANRPPNPGADGGQAPDKGPKGVAAQIVAAANKARGKK